MAEGCQQPREVLQDLKGFPSRAAVFHTLRRCILKLHPEGVALLLRSCGTRQSSSWVRTRSPTSWFKSSAPP